MVIGKFKDNIFEWPVDHSIAIELLKFKASKNEQLTITWTINKKRESS